MITRIQIVVIFIAILGASISGGTQEREETIQVLEAVAPVIPSILMALVERGPIPVEVIIGEDGQVKSVGDIKAPANLGRTLSSAARKWRFAPAEQNKSDRKIELVFVLTMVSSDAKSEELWPIFRPPYEVEIKARAPVIK